jgi:hypothetical protein
LPSFETPRKRAAPQDEVGDNIERDYLLRFREPVIERVAGAAHGADRILLAAGAVCSNSP